MKVKHGYAPIPVFFECSQCAVLISLKHYCTCSHYMAVDLTMLHVCRWEHHPTSGPTPLGVNGYASASIGRNIFYFAGYCGHGKCEHNNLTALSVDDFTWRELFPTTDITGPMRKSQCGLVAIKGQLLAVGGSAYSAPTHPSPSARYEKGLGAFYTNEHNIYDMETGEYILSLAQYVCIPCSCSYL